MSSRQLPDKLYFRIGEVATIVGVEPHVLRYWETEFRAIKPEKSRKGQRIYSRRDVDTLLKVKELLYSHRYTIAGARTKLRGDGVEPVDLDDPLMHEVQGLRQGLEALRTRIVQVLDEVVAVAAAEGHAAGAGAGAGHNHAPQPGGRDDAGRAAQTTVKRGAVQRQGASTRTDGAGGSGL